MLTLATFKERLDASLLAQLSDPDGNTPDDVKLAHALADAAAQIEGYLFTLPAADKPPERTLEMHQVSLTMYTLAGNRPGVEYASIRARYDSTIKWLESLNARPATGLAGSGSAPSPLMDCDSMQQFGDDL